MRYTFAIQRNIHMYNHALTVSDGQNSYRAIVESAPVRKETLLIWLGDFGFPTDAVDMIKMEMEKWFNTQNIECIFYSGKRV